MSRNLLGPKRNRVIQVRLPSPGGMSSAALSLEYWLRVYELLWGVMFWWDEVIRPQWLRLVCLIVNGVKAAYSRRRALALHQNRNRINSETAGRVTTITGTRMLDLLSARNESDGEALAEEDGINDVLEDGRFPEANAPRVWTLVTAVVCAVVIMVIDVGNGANISSVFELGDVGIINSEMGDEVSTTTV